ncbi:hypothetical protein RM572_25775 [Streptomyces sp. DSM 42041]|uniref:Uncharacterized protein n=1 Tax=Streptomyces hazeniae TaxID=3075538 RepID=A0ABU2NZJ2_9ACTN|nr:hypothetical protein [Streptomyces sp. DSM 42041]MDT0382174.1 hypothetical protein [Streptomyces sp. DSM 42041]
MPRTLDDVLNDACALPADDPDEEKELKASRERLAEDYFDAVQRGTAQGGFPHPALGPAPLNAAGPDRAGPVARRERAARDLRALSSLAIRTPDAATHITRLATKEIDADNALVFACLLHLADRDDQAEFFWQFAAGAGKTASAECLSLLHTVRGELRAARHWAEQAADLDDPETPRHQDRDHEDVTTRVRREPRLLYSLNLLKVWRLLRGEDSETLTMSAFHACAGTLSRALTSAIQRLGTEPGEAVLLTWPDRNVAAQLQGCAAR